MVSQVASYSELFLPEGVASPVPLPPEGLRGKELDKFLNKHVFPAFQTEQNRLRKLEAWGTGKQPEVAPLKRNAERAVLQRMARTPWLPLMVSTFAQQLIVDGYTKQGDNANSPAWKTWVRNNMASQQLAISRGTLNFGYTYLRVTSGVVDDVDENGQDIQKTLAVMRGVSALRAFALYEDPFGDEYPQYLLEKLPDASWRWWLPDGNYIPLTFKSGKFTSGEEKETTYGVVPFVRMYHQIDLEGRCWGAVEPVIDLAARIDKTAFDRLLVQHFNSFKVRWATGLEQADTPEGVEQDKIRIQHQDILIASDVQARFGTLDETSMEGFIEAYRSDLETFAAVMQLPPNLLGQVINVAADALDGARRQTYQKLFEMQTVMGEKYAQALRLAAHIEGQKDIAEDFEAEIHWQDVEVRSLSQFADAWGKIVDQLGVPKWAAWHKIPGVSQTEVEGWKAHTLDMDPLSRYLREVVGKTTTDLGVNAATGEPEAPPVNMDAIKATAEAKAAAAPAAPPGKPAGKGGPNSTQNQRPINNKTGVSRGTAT